MIGNGARRLMRAATTGRKEPGSRAVARRPRSRRDLLGDLLLLFSRPRPPARRNNVVADQRLIRGRRRVHFHSCAEIDSTAQARSDPDGASGWRPAASSSAFRPSGWPAGGLGRPVSRRGLNGLPLVVPGGAVDGTCRRGLKQKTTSHRRLFRSCCPAGFTSDRGWASAGVSFLRTEFGTGASCTAGWARRSPVGLQSQHRSSFMAEFKRPATAHRAATDRSHRAIHHRTSGAGQHRIDRGPATSIKAPASSLEAAVPRWRRSERPAGSSTTPPGEPTARGRRYRHHLALKHHSPARPAPGRRCSSWLDPTASRLPTRTWCRGGGVRVWDRARGAASGQDNAMHRPDREASSPASTTTACAGRSSAGVTGRGHASVGCSAPVWCPPAEGRRSCLFGRRAPRRQALRRVVMRLYFCRSSPLKAG